MDHVILGVDPSSRKVAVTTTWSGWNLPELFTIDLPENHSEGCGLAFRRFFEYISGVRERTGCTPFVFQEEPLMAFGRNMNANSTITQARIGGALEAACSEAMVPVKLINNKVWKKVVVGNGNAGKPEISDWVHENLPDAYDLAGGDQDLIDSACINEHGKIVLNAPKRVIRIRRLKVAA